VQKNRTVIDIESDSESPNGKKRDSLDSDIEDNEKPAKRNHPVIDIGSDSDSPKAKKRKPLESDSEDYSIPVESTTNLRKGSAPAKAGRTTSSVKSGQRSSQTEKRKVTKKLPSKKPGKVETANLGSGESALKTKTKSSKIAKSTKNEVDDDSNDDALPGSSREKTVS